MRASLEPFLYPCSTGFSIIVSGVCYLMWKNIARTPCSPTLAQQQLVRVTWRYSLRGVLAGMTVFGIHVAYYTVFALQKIETGQNQINLNRSMHPCIPSCNSTVTPENSTYVAGYQALATLSFILSTSILLFLSHLKRCLNGQHTKTAVRSMEGTLLVLGQTGVFLICLFYLGVLNGLNECLKPCIAKSVLYIFVLRQIVILIGSPIQTLYLLRNYGRTFLLDTEREYTISTRMRELVMFALIVNLCIWTSCIYEARLPQTVPLVRLIYGPVTVSFMKTVLYPFAILYSFKSTVMLYGIWKRLHTFDPVNVVKEGRSANT